jgi:hypothetical protein
MARSKAIGLTWFIAAAGGVVTTVALMNGTAEDDSLPYASAPLEHAAPASRLDKAPKRETASERPALPLPEGSGLSSAAVGDAQPIVAVRKGWLTVVADDRQLEWILAEISREGQVAIMFDDGVRDELVSIEFHHLPVDQGLRQILSRHDAFFYYTAGSLQAVWVYPLGGGSGHQPSASRDWANTIELEDRLSDPDPEERAGAIGALIERQGDGALTAVFKALADENEQVRTEALYRASVAGVGLPADVLSKLALTDPSESVRFLALEGLADDPNLAVIAEQALEDPSPHIRSHAQQILARLSQEDRPEEPTQ